MFLFFSLCWGMCAFGKIYKKSSCFLYFIFNIMFVNPMGIGFGTVVSPSKNRCIGIVIWCFTVFFASLSSPIFNKVGEQTCFLVFTTSPAA